MGTFQMSILLCFNDNDELTVKEIEEQTQLQQKELIKQIQSLIESKLIHVVHASTDELNEKTRICLNYDYINKRTKFKITAAVQKEAPQVSRVLFLNVFFFSSKIVANKKEAEVTQASVDDDRKIYLQAAIVRIMKSRKELNHNFLIQEVINQAKQRFYPSISLIKKCIEILIDKQYIERTKNKDEYSYIA
jgi:cullin 2